MPFASYLGLDLSLMANSCTATSLYGSITITRPSRFRHKPNAVPHILRSSLKLIKLIRGIWIRLNPPNTFPFLAQGHYPVGWSHQARTSSHPRVEHQSLDPRKKRDALTRFDGDRVSLFSRRQSKHEVIHPRQCSGYHPSRKSKGKKNKNTGWPRLEETLRGVEDIW